MVSFSCEACGDVLTKKKLDPHRNQCRGATFTCIDCMVHFQGVSYRSHTSCMSEAQKYEGALYKEKPKKGQRNNNRNNNNNQNAKPNGHRAPYVEDAPDVDNPKGPAAPPPAPSPPPTGVEKPGKKGAKQAEINVFDFLVNDQTPNASKVSLPGSKEPMTMVDHAPSVFETSNSLAPSNTDAGEDNTNSYDVAYEENGYSYGAGPIPQSVYPSKANNVSMEFMTPAPKKKKDRSRTNGDASATTSDKKRKRRSDDQGMDEVDTPMMDAPSSVVNHPGTPMLNHSGLTGGLNRMMRSPSLEVENDSADHPRRRYQDPSSPIKRTRRDEKDLNGDGLGISIKNRAERLVSSMFGGSVASGSSNHSNEPPHKAVVRSRRRSSSSDEGHAPVEIRRSKKAPKVRGATNGQVISADARKSKRKTSNPTDSGDRPSRRLKQLDYPNPVRGDDGQMVVYREPNVPDQLQCEMAQHFLSLVTKGPESGRGFSMNKVLKRFHRDFTDEYDDDRGRDQGRSRADRERRIEDEKDLWKTLRLKRNERGEVVVFF